MVLNDEKLHREEEKEQVGRSGAGTDRSWQAVSVRLAGGLWLSVKITIVSWQISHLTLVIAILLLSFDIE